MTWLSRKIEMAKWQPVDGLATDEIGADAVTGCLRSSSNTLSLWECDAGPEEIQSWSEQAGGPEIADIILALASTMERPARIDLVLLPRESLEDAGLTLRSSPEAATAPVDDVKRRHVDLVSLDLIRLSRVAHLVATEVRQDRSCRRFRKSEVEHVLRAAVRAGRLSEGDLRFQLSGGS